MIRFPKKIRKLLIKNVVITHARFIRIVNADRWKYLINKTIAHNRKKYPIKKRISDVKPPTEWAHIFSSKAYFLNAYLGKKNAVNKYCPSIFLLYCILLSFGFGLVFFYLQFVFLLQFVLGQDNMIYFVFQ